MKKAALIFIVLCLILSGCFPAAPAPEPTEPAQTTASPQISAVPTSPSPTPMSPELTVYFIDVGQADAALIECGTASMLIDGGNVGDSSLIYSFLLDKGISHLDYIVCTHAHEDHAGGLAGALHAVTADVVYSPVESYDSKAFGNFVKAAQERGLSLTIPEAGTAFSLGGAEVLILGPLKEYSEVNNTSIVLKVVFGATSFLFTGDMEREAELDLTDAGLDLSADVLKVGHHGSNTSSSYVFIYNVMPEYALISCGKDNQYGHPHEEVLSRLRDADVRLFRTDMQGTVTCVSDGVTLSFETERNPDAETNPT